MKLSLIILLFFPFTILNTFGVKTNASNKITVRHVSNVDGIKDNSLRQNPNLIWLGGVLISEMPATTKVIYSISRYVDTINNIFFIYLMQADSGIKNANISPWISIDALEIQGLSIEEIKSSSSCSCYPIENGYLWAIFRKENNKMNIYKVYNFDIEKSKIKQVKKTNANCRIITMDN